MDNKTKMSKQIDIVSAIIMAMYYVILIAVRVAVVSVVYFLFLRAIDDVYIFRMIVFIFGIIPGIWQCIKAEYERAVINKLVIRHTSDYKGE